jgi:chromosome segregation ATPase
MGTMTEYVTHDQLKRVANEAIDDMAEIVSSFAQQIADKFSVADVRFDILEAQLSVIAERLERYDDQSSELQRQVSSLQAGLLSLRQFVRRATRPITKLKAGGRKNWLAPVR